MEDLKKKIIEHKKLVIAIASVVLALISIFVFGRIFSDPEFHKKSIKILDSKKDSVMAITGALTVASTALTILPDDIATPVAEQLIDMAGGFAVVLGAVTLEKYLLTILFGVGFYVMIPVGFIINAINQYFNKEKLKNLFKKFVLFGLAISIAIPLSLFISNQIDKTYKASIDKTVDSAKNAAEDIEDISDGTEDSGSTSDDENNSWWDNVKEKASDLTTGVGEKVKQSVDKIKDTVNKFVEAMVIMIVVNCVIPVLTFLFLIWLIRIFFGIDKSPNVTAFIPAGKLKKYSRMGKGVKLITGGSAENADVIDLDEDEEEEDEDSKK
ncbi:MAG: hypothetical protein K6D02_07785 [Lachnospiraceae bacterium]|nr:hypothetical protein [Lachnospiraceae bacterium]